VFLVGASAIVGFADALSGFARMAPMVRALRGSKCAGAGACPHPRAGRARGCEYERRKPMADEESATSKSATVAVAQQLVPARYLPLASAIALAEVSDEGHAD
jgi:hypothetical protein